VKQPRQVSRPIVDPTRPGALHDNEEMFPDGNFPQLSKRWDAVAAADPERGYRSPAQRRICISKRGVPESMFQEMVAVPSHQWDADDDAVLSEATEAYSAPLGILRRASEVSSSSSSMPGKSLARMPVSKGADAACLPLDMEDDLESTEGDGEYIPGTLDYAPPAGTQVRVLYDDDHWYLAEVLSGSKSVVRVSFSDGKRATIDLERHAVRLADYDEDDSSDEGSEEDAVECTADASINCASSLDMEAESDDEFQQIPGTLDEAPPVGTLVQILYDDNEWVVARIAAVDGKKALVVSGSDKEEDEVDFDEHAIRLHPVDTSGDSAETEQTQEQNGCAELCVQGDIVIESVQANVEEALDRVASAAVLTQRREEHAAEDNSQLPMVIGSPSD